MPGVGRYLLNNWVKDPKLKNVSDSSIFQDNRVAECPYPPWHLPDPVQDLQCLPFWISKSDGGDTASSLRELPVWWRREILFHVTYTAGGGGVGGRTSPPPTRLSVSPHPLFPSCHFSQPSSALFIYFILTHLPVSSSARIKAPWGQNRMRNPHQRERTLSVALADLRFALWRSHHTSLKFIILDCFMSISCCNVCDNAVSCTGLYECCY